MGDASVATFPRHLKGKYGVPAGEASTVAARSNRACIALSDMTYSSCLVTSDPSGRSVA